MSKEAMKLALEVYELDQSTENHGALMQAVHDYLALAKQEQRSDSEQLGEPLPDFYITEKMADSIYKLKSPTWSLCISGNKAPTMHRTIPVFVGYVKTKPVEQEQGEPVAYGMRDTMIGKGNRMMYVRLDKGQDGCTVPLYEHSPAKQEQSCPECVFGVCHCKQEQGEPVAVIGSGFQLLYCRHDWSNGLKVGNKLYTTPQQRKPLEPTVPEDANINQRISFKAGWKAAEAAHGIKD